MNILITGITGFIGSNLTNLLKQSNHSILGISRNKTNIPNIKILKGDLKNILSFKKKIAEFQPDVVIHLAWQGIPDFSESNSKLNLKLSKNFFDIIFSQTHCKKIIVAGSCWEYGKTQGVCSESDKVSINNYFTMAKYCY